MMKQQQIILLVVGGVVLFLAGVGVAHFSRRPGHQFPLGGTWGMMGGPGGGFGGRGGMMRGGGTVNGEILSVDGKSLTVKLRDGGSKIVLLGDSTQINKAATGTAADLTQGTNVVIFGTTNSDGSVTAMNVQIRPAGAPMMSPPGGAPAASTTP
mgnify:CR=1 FL=1